MRLPRSGGLDGLSTVVRMRSMTYTFERPTEAVGRFGESDSSSTTDVDAEAWLFSPDEINADTEYGDRLGGDLQGLSMPSADIEVHDTVTHGGEEYEVQRIIHLPDDETQTLKMFSLQRVTNQR